MLQQHIIQTYALHLMLKYHTNICDNIYSFTRLRTVCVMKPCDNIYSFTRLRTVCVMKPCDNIYSFTRLGTVCVMKPMY